MWRTRIRIIIHLHWQRSLVCGRVRCSGAAVWRKMATGRGPEAPQDLVWPDMVAHISMFFFLEFSKWRLVFIRSNDQKWLKRAEKVSVIALCTLQPNPGPPSWVPELVVPLGPFILVMGRQKCYNWVCWVVCVMRGATCHARPLRMMRLLYAHPMCFVWECLKNWTSRRTWKVYRLYPRAVLAAGVVSQTECPLGWRVPPSIKVA